MRPTLRKKREGWGTHLWTVLPFHTVMILEQAEEPIDTQLTSR